MRITSAQRDSGSNSHASGHLWDSDPFASIWANQVRALGFLVNPIDPCLIRLAVKMLQTPYEHSTRTILRIRFSSVTAPERSWHSKLRWIFTREACARSTQV